MSIEQEILDKTDQGITLDPTEAARLLDMLDGETALGAELGNVPDVTQGEQKNNTVVNKPVDQPETVILAKDGKHTIPYDKLVEARDEAKDWRTKYEQQEQELASLRQASGASQNQAQENLQAAHAMIEASGNNTDVIALFGDFSEQSIANAVAVLVNQQVGSQVDALVQQKLNEINQETQQLSAQEQHFKFIGDAHPDWVSVVESSEFDAWKSNQPSYIQDGIDKVFSSGTAQQVTQVLSDYKTQNNLIENTTQSAIKQAAQQALNQAKAPVPISLSDLPSGSPASVSREERAATLSGAALLEEMANWSQEQIDDYTARHA